MKSGFSAVSFDTFFTVDSQQRTRGHSWKIVKHRSYHDPSQTVPVRYSQGPLKPNLGVCVCYT